jgi:carbonic anhydrase
MEKLFKGVLHFQQEDFTAQRELFSQLGRQQRPHTLFVGCSDSRVVPTLITNASPGELFVVRNIANIIPPYGESAHPDATMAAVEYAVRFLEVETIVICGHSNCGGCAAMNQEPDELAQLPRTRQWLQHSREVPARVAKLRQSDDPGEREWLTEHVNVLVQMRHVLTYPGVPEKVAAGTLRILGWYFVIATGEVLNFNDGTGRFEKVTG